MEIIEIDGINFRCEWMGTNYKVFIENPGHNCYVFYGICNFATKDELIDWIIRSWP